jgi:hypothetical protein
MRNSWGRRDKVPLSLTKRWTAHRSIFFFSLYFPFRILVAVVLTHPTYSLAFGAVSTRGTFSSASDGCRRRFPNPRRVSPIEHRQFFARPDCVIGFKTL